jgi:hypothetical protein
MRGKRLAPVFVGHEIYQPAGFAAAIEAAAAGT